MPKNKELEGIKGIIFDCYNTLIDIKTDDDSIDTFRPVCNWLIYQGVVSGGLKVLNFGGIKMPTSTAFGFKVNRCVDAEIGGVSHVKRTTRTGIEHQRDRQKDWLQPKDGS